MYNEEIVKKVQKLYKKYNNIAELSLINYEGLNYYVRLDYDKKKNLFYLRSINMNIIDKFDKNLINQEIILNQPVDYMCNILQRNKINEYDSSIKDSNADLVVFKVKLGESIYNYSFNLFIPQNIGFLADVLYMFFANLPQRMYALFDEMCASLSHNEIRYTYKKPFKFDIFKGDLTKVFNDKVIAEGTKYYENQKVRFIEKINNSYYATVEGSNNRLYTVIIDYNNKDKTIRMGCNCTCEFFCKHMFATILSIRNKDEFKYYKVRYIDEHAETMYDKLFTLNYFLCIGIDKDKLILVYPDGRIESVFILDHDGIPMFEVVEDDEEKTLTNYIKDLK